MSITSSTLTVTVEPVVASVAIESSEIIFGANPTIYAIANDSSGNPIPNAPVTIYYALADSNFGAGALLKNAEIKNGIVGSGVTGSNGQFSVAYVASKFPSIVGTTSSAYALQAESEGKYSSIIYIYPGSTISIDASTSEPISGVGYTITVHVATNPGSATPGTFGLGSTTEECKYYFQGYATVILKNTTRNKVYSQKTDSNGDAKFSITDTVTGTDNFIATAYGSASHIG
jgi:hypothetical protein